MPIKNNSQKFCPKLFFAEILPIKLIFAQILPRYWCTVAKRNIFHSDSTSENWFAQFLPIKVIFAQVLSLNYFSHKFWQLELFLLKFYQWNNFSRSVCQSNNFTLNLPVKYFPLKFWQSKIIRPVLAQTYFCSNSAKYLKYFFTHILSLNKSCLNPAVKLFSA